MPSNPEHGSQEHNKPKPDKGEVVFSGEPQPFQPAEQHAAERLGKPPPLHPIFERLSQALAKQQEAERSGKPHPPELPASYNQGEIAENSVNATLKGSVELEKRERREEKPPPTEEEIKAKNILELQRKDRRRLYLREYNRQWRQKHPERYREQLARRRRSEKGKAYKREWMREYRKKNKHSESA